MSATLTAGNPERVRGKRMKKLFGPPLALVAGAIASWAVTRMVKRMMQDDGSHK